jgi:hypothetical protein
MIKASRMRSTSSNSIDNLWFRAEIISNTTLDARSLLPRAVGLPMTSRIFQLGFSSPETPFLGELADWCNYVNRPGRIVLLCMAWHRHFGI